MPSQSDNTTWQPFASNRKILGELVLQIVMLVAGDLYLLRKRLILLDANFDKMPSRHRPDQLIDKYGIFWESGCGGTQPSSAARAFPISGMRVQHSPETDHQTSCSASLRRAQEGNFVVLKRLQKVGVFHKRIDRGRFQLPDSAAEYGNAEMSCKSRSK